MFFYLIFKTFNTVGRSVSVLPCYHYCYLQIRGKRLLGVVLGTNALYNIGALIIFIQVEPFVFIFTHYTEVQLVY